MTNELKQAAERLKRIADGEPSKIVYGFALCESDVLDEVDYDIIARQRERDRKLLADHYLAQQAEDADGDEPVTYAWAKALPNAIDQGGCCFFRCINDIELWVSDDEGVVLHRCGGELELEIANRRALRQLLQALGITTKGTEP